MENAIAFVKKIVKIKWSDIYNVVFAIMLGRVVFFDCFSPFALALFVAYIANCPDNMIGGFLVALGALFGVFTAGMGITFLKYILAFVLFALIFTAVTTITNKKRKYLVEILGAISLFVAGLIFIGQWNRSYYYLFMLVAEALVCFCMAVVFSKSIEIANDPKTEITTDSSIGFLVLVALSVVGFGDLTIYSISVGKVLSGLYIMVISLCGGLGSGSTCGVVTGVLYSFLMYPTGEYMGLYSILGMLCGLASKHKKAGVITAFLVAACLMTGYFGVSNGAMYSVLEMLITVSVFCLLPKSIFVFVENVLCAINPIDGNFKETISKIAEKLTDFSKKVSEIADNFYDHRKPQNKNDIMLIYDKTASKVCRSCGLRFVCWEKEFAKSYDDLLHCTPSLVQKAKLEIADIPMTFRSKCIKLTQFTETVNKYYARYKLDTMWVKKLEAEKQLTATHLYGVSQIMDSFAKDTKKQLDFVPNLGNILYLSIRKQGIKCYDTTVVTSDKGQLEVIVRVKIKKEENIENVIADIVAQTVGRRFYVKDANYAKDKLVMRLLERERYNVVTGFSARKKDDSTSSGDSYCQQKLQHNRYLAILSDGMGSGKVARNQSRFAVETLSRLLNTGFDKESAVKIMNLSLFLKQTEESFATVDAVVVDLFEGNAEFIKIGASSSYVKSGENVKKITSDSLPAGIVTDVTPCTEKIDIKGGDVIVLASDGVVGEDGNWIPSYIESCKDKPQKLAEGLIKKAIVNQGHTAKDDMTVIAMLIDEEIA